MDKEQKKPHGFEVKDRNFCNMYGVEKVVSSSENLIDVVTFQGGMEINGKNLKINRFDVNDGTLTFEGEIDCVKYSAPKTPLLKRLFK